MSGPAIIRENTLTTLRGTRRDMSRAKWLRAVGKKPPEVRREAALIRMDIEQALLALGNEKLASISEKLKENETSLVEGRAELILARKKLERVEKVLGSASKILEVLAKIVTFPSGL